MNLKYHISANKFWVYSYVDLFLNSNQELECGHLTSAIKHDTNMAWIVAISSTEARWEFCVTIDSLIRHK